MLYFFNFALDFAEGSLSLEPNFTVKNPFRISKLFINFCTKKLRKQTKKKNVEN